jgi:hypothetical protein
MKKAIFSLIAISFILVPSISFAAPIDQYGRFTDSNGQENYIYLNDAPNYLSGNLASQVQSLIFYVPEVKESWLADKSIIVTTPMLSANPNMDKLICTESKIYAGGRYNQTNLVRIKPVCADAEDKVKQNTKILAVDYYKELPSGSGQAITKVFHIKETAARKIYTDRPDLADLKDKIIQGETDPAMYYVGLYNSKLMLRKILDDKARSMWGNDYQSKILYFSDSIIYSYQRGYSIY